MNIKAIIEAALFAAQRPLNLAELQKLFGEQNPPAQEQLRAVLAELAIDYQARPMELKEVASGYRFQVRSEYAPWVTQLFEERVVKYSRAVLETLAIIAYRQPVTRGDIEAIRGVSVSSPIMRMLLEREWIKAVGHKEVPGRPALYATTRAFLDYFNLKSLGELPPLKDFSEIEALFPTSVPINEPDQETDDHAQPA